MNILPQYQFNNGLILNIWYWGEIPVGNEINGEWNIEKNKFSKLSKCFSFTILVIFVIKRTEKWSKHHLKNVTGISSD
jgi:hypothetical protein